MELPTKIKMYGCTERKLESADSIRQSTIIPFQLLPKLAILLVLILAPFYGALAQNEDNQTDEFATTIKIAGRYVPGTGIELRYFPEKRLVMETGFRHGFIIERSPAGVNDFVEIARLLPFNDEAWDTTMEEAEGEAFDLLDLARGFLQAALTPSGGTFDFDAGISDMRQQRGDEDLEHAIFMITAAREARVAEALALSFTDENIIEGESYTYRVRTVIEPQIYNLIPEPLTIEAVPDEDKYENEVFFYEGDTWINFVWEEDDKLSLYEVERRDPGTETFVLLTDAPRINLRGKEFDEFQRSTYRDEELENYQLYTYRFYGHNIFGERILFAEVEAMPRDRTPPEPPGLTTLKHHAPQEVLLEWEMNDPPAPDLMGFVIGRGNAPDGDFRIIHPELLPENTRSFTDTTFIEGQLNYYVIQAVDTAFNVSSSMPAAVTLIDTIPPVVPVWISGKIDSLGIVTLEVERNPESDLMGYRLFRANDPDHEFSVIFEGFVDDDSLQYQISTIFKDTVTLNSLTPRIYYKVKALDFNFNQSDFSEMMVIDRPDTIPPTTPVFKRVVSRTNEIELHFALSESRDVASHELYRITDMQEPWELYSLLDNDQQVFIDTSAIQGTTYYYSIRAIDNSGNHSDFARPVYAKAYDDGVRPTVENLTLQEQDGMLLISWEYGNVNDETFFAIYKSNGNGNMVYYTRTQELAITEGIPSDTILQYSVKVFTADGGESLLSEPVTWQP
jgi:uncharacterized protein